eukprot:TRINITY_DN2967_c0_g1_i3.p1 TRINITY_DN2967_c0_g1~~TRINITY_DN2967_c0_g1_i3.p1  ORF type:complete len:177 (+),score=44.61 TRINITY_DN2967_c0_g1_i3:70-531(+)
MDVNVMFSADQIAIPPELAPILRHYTKAVLRNEEEISQQGLNKWTANYFAELGGMPKVFNSDGSLAQRMNEAVGNGYEQVPWGDQTRPMRDRTLSTVSQKYVGVDGMISKDNLSALLQELKKDSGVVVNEDAIANLNPDSKITQEELRDILFP